MNILFTYALEEERISSVFANQETKFLRTGVGKVASAVALTHAMAERKPHLVINFGTAGTTRHNVGDIAICTTFVDRDLKKENLPGITWRIESTHVRLAGIPSAGDFIVGTCNTGDSFLTQTSEADDDMYDMEAYAQAYACQQAGVPFVAVKYATDKIGENSIKHWEDKLEEARKALTRFFDTHQQLLFQL